ncbi:histidine phosphatase family protein [Ancylobacter rudongensis]|jgi:probable phosphoglycerate mutase|uniref:Probable phosphoglycerate mutase n=1 Tax=Ancylobacter rudongensis TaxID=177413 RepID=A0A1G4RNI1_9HYPH|nr:histidine phosphatase family protein [Ancylobacter rudongensis]RTM00399.1 histidine phosphatase family protein [Ancylobacter aquaticus]SCW58492.1 probable phosphoglycerate mutase [Ancylobacter rudongensis]
MTRRIFLVRHGETDWNLAGRLQGTHDIPLNDLGREQAADTARVVERLSGGARHLDFVASPLSRAAQTMAILRAELGLPPDTFRRDPRLREISFGRWEGSTWPELRRRDPVSLAARDADPWNFAPPGGESYTELSTRVLAAIGELQGDSVVVTHGGVVRAMLHAFAGMPPAQAVELPVRQGAVYLIENGAFELAVA